MRFKSDVGSSPPPFKRVVMTTGALACPFLGENMGKKNIFILCFFFFTFLLSADEFIYKLQNPRINNKEVEYIQKSLSKINLLPEKEIDGWYGPVTEKAVKKLQKIIGVKETGEVNSELYKFLINENLSEIIKIDKIEKHETFEKVLDCSGYIFEVYYENTEIKKIIKKYWVAYAPNYKREEQYSETIYYLNNQYVQKWIQDSDAKWNFNLEEKEGKA